MSEDQALALTGTLGALVLVAASLLTRRLPIGRVARLALIWFGIFAGLLLVLRLFPGIAAYFT
ncbi:hypothetical protein [Sphingomonas profundi]|uniref:hypothetical protein n=1 Tax=Alterirhizorhabdus profundi TaxID=2681549 RepID=UPI0012E8ACDD|nr:hypothetical protein [Sphingomonas profundi]